MADKRISELTNITGANLADADEFVVVDSSANETKAITWSELKEGLDTGTGFVRITGDTMTGDLDVQGTVTADGLTVDGNTVRQNGTLPFYLFMETDTTDLNTQLIQTAGQLRIRTVNDAITSSTERLRIDHSTGDISFYEDTGTTPKLFWDASAEALALGTSTTVSNNRLVIEQASGDGANSGFYLQRNGAAGTSFKIDIDSSDVVNFRRSTTQAMAITSSGNVGIDNTAPDGNLTVGNTSTSGDVSIRIKGNATSRGFLMFGDAGGAQLGDIMYDHSTDHMRFRVNNAERMRITSSGSVGIGTSSPATNLHVKSSAFGDIYQIQLEDGGGNVGLKLGQYGGVGEISGLSGIDFEVNESRKMRIDASGNLLVGTTDNNVSNNSGTSNSGINLLATGQVFAAYAGNVANFNQLGTSGGSIINFDVDGTTVGSIGTRAGYLRVGSGDTGLFFNPTSDEITPENIDGNTFRDAAIDLGTGAARFKDLFLSGGIYQGNSDVSYTPFTVIRHRSTGAGGSIFTTLFDGKAQMGHLYAYDTTNNNWCSYLLKKNDQNSTISVQFLAGTGLTITATNTIGTIQMSATTGVKMLVTIYVVEN